MSPPASLARADLLARLPQLGGRPTVLLFYDGYELRLLPGRSGRAYSRLRGLARYLYRRVRRRQVWTGFYTAFRALVTSLRQYGCEVRINDLALAARHPAYPIGIAGYPSVLAAADLPNPRLFGPGDYGYPDTAAEVAADPRNRILTQPSEWPVEYYRAACGAKLRVLFVGIDTEAWPDLSARPKDIDVLIYDKIRWHDGAPRRDQVPEVLARLIRHLDQQGRSHLVLRYGRHPLSQFRAALARSRSMAFLCEHETQGLAYQEAMASNVPIFALDEGVLADPQQLRFARPGLLVSSVPYFDATCGERFVPEQLEAQFARFWTSLPGYAPRAYVMEHLSLRRAAETYLTLYASLA